MSFLMLNFQRWKLFLFICFYAMLSQFLYAQQEGTEGAEITNDGIIRRPPNGFEIKPIRNKPVFQGAFSVGVAIITFPDTVVPTPKEVKDCNFNFGYSNMSATDYFKSYSQHITWPIPYIMGEDIYPKNVYQSTKLYGYYCRYNMFTNPIGWKTEEVGKKRVSLLKKAAKKFILRKAKAPTNIQTRSGNKPHVLYFFYCGTLKPEEELESLIKPIYDFKTKKQLREEKRRARQMKRMRRISPDDDDDAPQDEFEPWRLYTPVVNWAEPLWPNSSPQQFVDTGAKTFCHELGHILGAPDFYHAPEKSDGVAGTPCLPMAYGPTGPGYCRYMYNSFLTKDNYPTIRESGEYTLFKRSLTPAGSRPVGFFIPSAHPHYMYNIEYISNEEKPLQTSNAKGVLVNVINVTKTSPFLGSPDMCYTYRENDTWFRGTQAVTPSTVLFNIGNGKTKFNKDTNPSSQLPNLLDGGLSMEIVNEYDDRVVLKIDLSSKTLSSSAYKRSLIPKIKLDKVDGALATSFHCYSTMKFRGEPLVYEYGFCYSLRPHPTLKAGKFQLYHRDRYDGRILELIPNKKYYVRAYAKNKVGVYYSKEELTISTLEKAAEISNVPPLLNDDYTNRITSPSVCMLMKLTAYYRTSVLRKRKKGKINYTRIHTAPSENKPEFRVKEFEQVSGKLYTVTSEAQMTPSEFEVGFDKQFSKLFKIKKYISKGVKSINELTESSLPQFDHVIKAQLERSMPVVVGLETKEVRSYYDFPIHWILIDGYNNQGQYHITVPNTSNENSRLQNGWVMPLEILKDVGEAKIIFGWPNPLKL